MLHLADFHLAVGSAVLGGCLAVDYVHLVLVVLQVDDSVAQVLYLTLAELH